jgi:hypothetical protein
MLGEQFQQTLAAFVIHHLSPPYAVCFCVAADSVDPKVALCGKKSNEELKGRQSLNDQTIDYLAAGSARNARFDQPDD